METIQAQRQESRLERSIRASKAADTLVRAMQERAANEYAVSRARLDELTNRAHRTAHSK